MRSTGDVLTRISNSFGYFVFEDLAVGDLYIMSVAAKQYRFASDTVSFSLNESLSDITFVRSNGRFDLPVATVSAKNAGK